MCHDIHSHNELDDPGPYRGAQGNSRLHGYVGPDVGPLLDRIDFVLATCIAPPLRPPLFVVSITEVTTMASTRQRFWRSRTTVYTTTLVTSPLGATIATEVFAQHYLFGWPVGSPTGHALPPVVIGAHYPSFA